MPRYSESLSVFFVTICSLLNGAVLASQTGIPGYSQNETGPASCHACHSPSMSSPTNMLTLTGSQTVLAGSVNNFVIHLLAPFGQNAAYAGFDLSASNGLLISPDGESAIMNSELVHSNRKATTSTGSGYEVQWNASWQAPATAGTATLFACALPVDGDGSFKRGHHGSGDGDVACTTLTIQVQQLPTALAGNNQTVDEFTGVMLDGSSSGDPDGTIIGYQWTQISGTAVTLNNATTSTASFTAPDAPTSATEELVFELTVTDNDGLTDIDTISIFVRDSLVTNTPPVADAGVDQNVSENTPVNLDASASSDDGSIVAYLWQQTNGVHTVTLNNPTTANPDFNAPTVDSAGDVLTFKLTVTDDLGVSSTDTMIVTVNDVDTPPTAVITDASGVPISAIGYNTTVTLYGNFSSDPEGPITAYNWSQTAGSLIINPGPANESSFTFTTPNVPGNTIDIRLTVTGDQGVVQNATTTSFTLNNLPPEVDAGSNQTVVEGSVIDLIGTVTDANNNLASVQWRQINCASDCFLPPQAVSLPLIANVAEAHLVAPSIAPEDSGLLLDFELIAVDADGLSATSIMQVAVNDNGVTGFPADAITFTSFNNQPMAISIASLDSTGSATLTGLSPEDDGRVTDNLNRPLDFPYDLTNLEIAVPASGTVRVTLYFPEPVPDNVDFYQYLSDHGWVNTSRAKNFSDLTFDGSSGWAEISEEVEFSADRTRVTMLLTDGGPSDDDGLVNGVILNKGGLGVNPAVSVEQSGASGSFHPVWLFAMILLWSTGRRKA